MVATAARLYLLVVIQNDTKLIEEITNHVDKILNPSHPIDSARDDRLVGINSRVEKVMSMIHDPEDASIIGIWGEPRIGKTTVAQATFDRIASEFDHRCFVGDIREYFEKFTIAAKQNEVLSECFGIRDSIMSWKMFSRKKVILFLDDVSDVSLTDFILPWKAAMGRRSRIIVTSRDRHLLKSLDAKIYAVEKLNDREALQLFSLHAFNGKVPAEGCLELSERVVKYAQGLPSVLEDFGLNINQSSVEKWEDKLEMFICLFDTKIHEILITSPYGLSNMEMEMEIQQDIASCFRGRKIDEMDKLMIEDYITLRKWRSLNNVGVISSIYPTAPTFKYFPNQ